MPLTDEQIKEIAGKVVNSLSPQGGSAPEYGQESPLPIDFGFLPQGC